VFERIKQRSRALKFATRGSIVTPVEIVIGLLSELRYHPAMKPSTQQELDYAIYLIKNNKLYDASEQLLVGQTMDKDTQDYIRNMLQKKNPDEMTHGSEHSPDAEKDTDGTSNSSSNHHQHHGRPLGSRRSSTSGDTLANHNSAATRKHSSEHHHDRRPPPLVHADTETPSTAFFSLSLDIQDQFMTVLADLREWTFDVFHAQHVLQSGHVLTHLGYFLLHDLGKATLDLESKTLAIFLDVIQAGYVAENPYHNSIHAADVMQTCFYFTSCTAIEPLLRPLDKTLLLIAAAIHDYKHDGFNNGFHIASGT
jgi:hypothetical protein